MNEEEKKAIDIVKNITADDLLNYWEGPEEPYNAIQTVLNLIEKQQKELEMKNAVIDKMAEMLVKVPENIDEPKKLSLVHFLNEHLEEKKQRVINYILNLVEKENK